VCPPENRLLLNELVSDTEWLCQVYILTSLAACVLNVYCEVDGENISCAV
jgi:hypothetical protein